ncbi:MAG: hypothetical protein U0930_04775 [Pirellulales bacterium]
MAATTTLRSTTVPHFAEPTSVTTTFDVDSVSGRFVHTNLDVAWTDKEGRKRLRTITSISKDYAWRRARNFAQKLASQGLRPTISTSPDRPLMMQLVDLKTGNVEQKIRCYSMDEAVTIAARFARRLTKLPVFYMAPMV